MLCIKRNAVRVHVETIIAVGSNYLEGYVPCVFLSADIYTVRSLPTSRRVWLPQRVVGDLHSPLTTDGLNYLILLL